MRSSMVVTVLVSTLAVTAVCAAPAGGVPWQPLFNGKDLDGWIQRGGKALYTVEDGAIVGTSVAKTPNSFLCTEKEYGDFVLELELKVDPSLNSGIQIRSESYRAYQNWRVHGYQVEIDPSERAWSGGIYDEARRGWLNDLTKNEAARKAFKVDGWNTYRVEAIGDSIKTWVNGVPAADLVDSMTLTGFIALQVHGTDKPGTKVMWRNIRIQDLGRHRWQRLFDGVSLAGWHALPGGDWEVKDATIVATSPASEARHGLLVSDRQFGDFTARLSFLCRKGNSGFYFRAEPVEGAVGVHGFQAEIDAAKDVGGLYETGGRAWVVQPSPEAVSKWFKPQEWNEMVVSAHGRRIVVHVNGRKTAELVDDPGRLEGHLALQLHGGMDMDVSFKDIEILVPEREADAQLLFDGEDLANWNTRPEGDKKSCWSVGVASVSPENPKLLVVGRGEGEMINAPPAFGAGIDIYTRERLGDCRLDIELMVPRESNSGIYVMGEYEVQVLDSFGHEKMSAADIGAIYGASPPPINASRKPGSWQRFEIEFRAPIFDADGKKVRNAVFERVRLNGHELHRDLVMPANTPGGVAGREAPVGPLMFQGNHGPVAYRNVKVWKR
ncbi:MAG: DUF1080 domain-containing protein [Planctomycetes bacterium]|nr:DUF1080 domain-containing protein [Planctomycetota bacterium]